MRANWFVEVRASVRRAGRTDESCRSTSSCWAVSAPPAIRVREMCDELRGCLAQHAWPDAVARQAVVAQAPDPPVVHDLVELGPA